MLCYTIDKATTLSIFSSINAYNLEVVYLKKREHFVFFLRISKESVEMYHISDDSFIVGFTNALLSYSLTRLAGDTALRPSRWVRGEEGSLFQKHPL